MRLAIILSFILLYGCKEKAKVEVTASELPDSVDTLSALEQALADEAELRCVYSKSNQKISTTFPFNQSDQIELVAYPGRDNTYSKEELVENGKFMVAPLVQRRALSAAQKDSLFAILFNFKRASVSSKWVGGDCYDPHHAIVFYKKDKAIAFFEICFSCHKTKQTKGIDFGELCDEKICTLQRFFLWCNVSEQIDDGECKWKDSQSSSSM